MRYLLLFLLPGLLLGSKILSYNVYERSNRVDVMLTFDTPFEGRLSQSKKENTTILKLEGASIEAPKIKTVKTSYLHKMTITPINSHTEIILQTASGVTMQASKTSDAYGLRLRLAQAAATPKQTASTTASSIPDLTSLPTRQSGEFNNSYYVVIGILLLGILLMLWLKKRMGPPHAKGKQPWLFKAAAKKEGISIRFQKPLDPKNRVAMLDYEGQSYLVLLGNTNILLDKYIAGKPVNTQSEFDQILNDNKSELDSYLQLDSSEVEPLQSYKQKASAQIHELV